MHTLLFVLVVLAGLFVTYQIGFGAGQWSENNRVLNIIADMSRRHSILNWSTIMERCDRRFYVRKKVLGKKDE